MLRRKKRGDARPFRLADVLVQTHAGKAAKEQILSAGVWQEVAGIAFAKRTRPDRVYGTTLQIIVASSAWAQEAAMHEKVILERLRARGLVVARLRFVVGEVVVPEHLGLVVRKVPLPTSPPVGMVRPLTKVRDEGLRNVLHGLALALARFQARTREREEAHTRTAGALFPDVPGARAVASMKNGVSD